MVDRSKLTKAQRIVVKVGTSVLTHRENQIHLGRVRALVTQMSSLLKRDKEIILVSSGAIACGMGIVGIAHRPRSLPVKQACAAIGQGQLIQLYDRCFRQQGHHTAQVLLTQEDFNDRLRSLNAKQTLTTLLSLKTVPIVNENDTVATQEIQFGDNDRLSALVASLIEAQALVILSDVDGLYDKDHQVVSTIEEITPTIERLAKGTGKETSLGGMTTKLDAARIATASGIPVVIANGHRDTTLVEIFEGKPVGTLCVPAGTRLASRKRWIAFLSQPQGRIIVDHGAKEALLTKGRSLLSMGVIGCEGHFRAGEIVSVLDERHGEFARGLTNYSTQELHRIKRRKTAEIPSLLGFKGADEVIHRDNLVIMKRRSDG